MKTPVLLASLLAFSLTGFAGGYTPNPFAKEKAKKESAGFWHHTGEFQLAPSADYMLYRKGTDYEASEPYEFRMPFIGFDIGGQYMYRPVEVFAISAGLGFRMQGSYYRHTTTFFGDKYVDETIAAHTGYLNLPVELHLFKRMSHSTFEFATGPRFNFPLFRKSTYSTFNSDGEKVMSGKNTQKLDADDMRDLSSLGWSLTMGGEIHLFNHGDLFIGPQINFQNLVYFNNDARSSVKQYGDYIDCSLGLKLGFRFHCETTAGYK